MDRGSGGYCRVDFDLAVGVRLVSDFLNPFNFCEMKALIACEESQAVTIEFRKIGIEAYSCDILPCSGGHPEWHIQSDVLPLLKEDWGLVISFPPCTDLAVSGARWFSAKRLSGEQYQSIKFFLDVWEKSNCTENPIGIMNGGKYIKKWFPDLWARMQDIKFPVKATQIIQPWMFGHGETKATCLWLNGLPKLVPTEEVEGRDQRIWKLPPSEDRAKLRSKTYQGIAQAMAAQWTKYL